MAAAIFLLFLISVFLYLFYKALRLEISSSLIKTGKKIKPPYAVISVKNGEDCIEGVIRSFIWQMRAQNGFQTSFISDLVVIDLGSDDNTAAILKKLSSEYDFVHTMNKKQYIESFNAL